MSSDNPIRFVYYGHHKVASSWLRRVLWNVMCDCGVRFIVYDRVGNREREEIQRLIAEQDRPISFGIANSMPEDVKLFTGFQALHVIRDPREMVISGYYSHRDSHPLFSGLKEERERLRQSSFEEGLKVIMEGLMRSTFDSLLNWPEDVPGRLTEIRFEKLVSDYEAIWRLFESAAYTAPTQVLGGWPIRAWNQGARRLKCDAMLKAEQGISRKSFKIHVNRIERDIKRERQKAKKKGWGHYRPKDVKVGWEEAFTPDLHAHFENLYPGLVERLGYTKWKGPYPSMQRIKDK